MVGDDSPEGVSFSDTLGLVLEDKKPLDSTEGVDLNTPDIEGILEGISAAEVKSLVVEVEKIFGIKPKKKLNLVVVMQYLWRLVHIVCN